MNGHVDSAGRALVRVGVKPFATATGVEIDAWVDTGFTGELVLPQERIAALRLPRSAVVKAELASVMDRKSNEGNPWQLWEVAQMTPSPYP